MNILACVDISTDAKWLKEVKNCLRQIRVKKTAGKGWKLLKTDKNYGKKYQKRLKTAKSIEKGLKQLKAVENVWKWLKRLKTVENRLKRQKTVNKMWINCQVFFGTLSLSVKSVKSPPFLTNNSTGVECIFKSVVTAKHTHSQKLFKSLVKGAGGCAL